MKPTKSGNYTLRKNQTVVTDINVLKSSGNINHGFVLSKGDKIVFPEKWEEVYLASNEIGARKFTAYHIGVLYNGKERTMPVGSVRRNPYNALEVLKDYPINLEIIQLDDDYARVGHLLDKTLVVTDIKEFDFTIYDAENGGAKRDAEGNLILRKEKIPIFTIV